MAEEKKCEEVLTAIREKNVISFKSVYYSMHKPLEEIYHHKIVLNSVKNCFTEGIRILINENSVDYYNAFRAACKIGQIEIVKMLLDPDQCDEFLTSSDFKNFDGLSIALKTGNLNLVKVLFESGKFDVENVPLQNTVSSGLFNALKQTNEELASFLIQRGANVKYVDFTFDLHNISCVCLSAMKIPSLTVEIVNKGADVNDTHEETGKTVLQLAIESDADRDVVKEIVQLGADLGRKDKRGNTALSYLKSIDQLYGLIDAGVTVEELEQKLDFSTLGFVVEEDFHGEDDVNFFLEKGANVNFNDKRKSSPLIRAVKYSSQSERDVKILLQHGADPHQKDRGYTPLQINCKRPFSFVNKTALFLLEYGASPMNCLFHLMKGTVGTLQHTQKKWLEYDLYKGMKQNLCVITEELIKHGANTNLKGCKRMSTLSYVCQLDQFDPEFRCLKAVLRRPTKLDYYAYQNHVDAVVNTATEMFQQSGSQRLLTFDLRGVFQLFVAGLDLVPRENLEGILLLASYGLYESLECFLHCGFLTEEDQERMKSRVNRSNESFEAGEESYTPHIPEKKKISLTSALNELKEKPVSLQKLCRLKIRKRLAFCGHSILPKIEEFEIPAVLKSYLKFEDIEGPQKEVITVNFTQRQRRTDWDDSEDSDPDSYDHDSEYISDSTSECDEYDEYDECEDFL